MNLSAVNNVSPAPSEPLKIHPLANVYRMHIGEELDDLVASIKRNGLRDPITIDGEGQIIDGRNRDKACMIAGVEPRFEIFEGDDEEIAEFIHDKNSCRRDLTTGQKALAYALLFPEKEKTGPKNGEKSFPINGEIPSQRISDARAILKFAPGDVEAIKQGDEPFTKIAEKAKAIKRQQEPSETRVAKLAKEDDHLATLVRQNDISIEAAEAELQIRKQRIKERRSKAIGFFQQVVSTFEGCAEDDFFAFMTESLADPIFRAELIGAVAMDAAMVRQIESTIPPAAENLRAILKSIEEKF